MHTEGPREEPLVDLGYEIRDIDYKRLGVVSIAFVAFVLFSFGSVGIWFWLATPKTNSLISDKKPLPTIPIQSDISVRADIQVLRQHETEILTKGGTNPDGSLRIPIDQAMNIVATRGLASKPTNVPAFSPHNTIRQNAVAPGTQVNPSPPSNPPTDGGPAMQGDIGVTPGAGQ